MIDETRIEQIAEAFGCSKETVREVVIPDCTLSAHHAQFLAEAPIAAVIAFVREFRYALDTDEQQGNIPLAAFWMLANGRLPESCFRIEQTCENFRCVHPDHLVLVKLPNPKSQIRGRRLRKK